MLWLSYIVGGCHWWCLSSSKCLQSDKLRKALMRGYSPIVRAVDLGKEAEYVTTLEPRQRICYYPGKLHGGMQAFFLDNLFADCCQGALTANLTISYLRPINPQATLSFRAWPVKVEGRKTFMEGCIKFLDGNAGVMVEAVRAKALFIRPKHANALKTFWYSFKHHIVLFIMLGPTALICLDQSPAPSCTATISTNVLSMTPFSNLNSLLRAGS